MAGLSDDDLPTMSSAEPIRDDAVGDGDTTAALEPPAEPADEEDRTVQQKVGAPTSRISSPEILTKPVAEPGTKPVPEIVTKPVTPPATPAIPRPTSRKMTDLGLGAPPPPTRPAAGIDPKPSPSSPSEASTTEADEIDDSVTATAPAPKRASIPLSVPGHVEIRAIEDDLEEGDATEVRTMPGLSEDFSLSSDRAVTPAAGAPATPSDAAGAPSPSLAAPTVPQPSRVEDDEDSVTTAAASLSPEALEAAKAAVGVSAEPVTDRETTSTKPALAEPAKAEPADAYDDEESVTTRAPVAAYEDDSVTTQAPVTRAVGAPAVALPPIEEGTDATTNKIRPVVPRVIPAAGRSPEESSSVAASSPADEESESITTQAPGHLTNMLRVIASGEQPEALEGEDEDELPENKTAVMINAPLKPGDAPSSGRTPRANPSSGFSPLGPTHVRTAAAPQLQPSSESGLRVARHDSKSGDRASERLLGAANGRASGVGPNGLAETAPPMEGRGLAFAATEALPGMAGEPSVPGFDIKKPRYGLLVAGVALLSISIPIALFVFLNRSSSDLEPRVPAEVAPDPVTRGDAARARAPRSHHSPSTWRWGPRRR